MTAVPRFGMKSHERLVPIREVNSEFGIVPNNMKLLKCVGGRSAAMGFWNEFMDTDS